MIPQATICITHSPVHTVEYYAHIADPVSYTHLDVYKRQHIFYMQQLEDVVDAYAGFDVRGLAHDMAGGHAVAQREEEEVGVAAFVGVVLVREHWD